MLASGTRDRRSRSGSKPRRGDRRNRTRERRVRRGAAGRPERILRTSPLYGVKLDSDGRPNLNDLFNSGSESEGDMMGPLWNRSLIALASEERERQKKLADQKARVEAEAARKAAEEEQRQKEQGRRSTHLVHEDLEPSARAAVWHPSDVRMDLPRCAPPPYDLGPSPTDGAFDPRTPPQAKSQSRTLGPAAIYGRFAADLAQPPHVPLELRSVPNVAFRGPGVPTAPGPIGPMATASNVPMHRGGIAADNHSQGFHMPPPNMSHGVYVPQHSGPGQVGAGTGTSRSGGNGEVGFGGGPGQMGLGGRLGGVGFGSGPGQLGFLGGPGQGPGNEHQGFGAGPGRMGAVGGPGQLGIGGGPGQVDFGYGPGRAGGGLTGVGPMYPASYPARQIDDHGGSALPGPSAALSGRVIDDHGNGLPFGRPSHHEVEDRIWEDSDRSRNGSNISGDGFGSVREDNSDYMQHSVSDRPVHRSSDANSSGSFAGGSQGPPGSRADSSGPHSTQPSTRPSTDAVSERPLDASGEPPMGGASVEHGGADASFRSPLTPRQAIPQGNGVPVRSPMACLSAEEAPTAQLARPGAPPFSRPIPVPALDLNRWPPHLVGHSPRAGGDENRDANQRSESLDKDGGAMKHKSASASRRSRSTSLQPAEKRADEGSPQGHEGRGRPVERSSERGRSVLGELPNNGNHMPEIREAPGSPEGVNFMTPMSTYYPNTASRPALQPNGAPPVEPRRLSLRSREDPRPEANAAAPTLTLPDHAVPAPQPSGGDAAGPTQPQDRAFPVAFQPREFAGRMSPVQEQPDASPPPSTTQTAVPSTRPVVAPEPVGQAMPQSHSQDAGSQTRPLHLPSVAMPAPSPPEVPAGHQGLIPNGVPPEAVGSRLLPNGLPPESVTRQPSGADPASRAQGIQTQGRMPPPTHASWARPPPWAHGGAHAIAANQMGRMGNHGQMGPMGHFGGPPMPGPGGFPPMGYPPGMPGMGYPGMPGIGPYGMPMQEFEEEPRCNAATVAGAIGEGVRMVGSATVTVAGAAAPPLGRAAVGLGKVALSGISAAAQAGLRMARGDPDAPQAGPDGQGHMRDARPPPRPEDAQGPPPGPENAQGPPPEPEDAQGLSPRSEDAGADASQESSVAGLLLPGPTNSNRGSGGALPNGGPSVDGGASRTTTHDIGVGPDTVAKDLPGGDYEPPGMGLPSQEGEEWPGPGSFNDSTGSIPSGDSPPPGPPPGPGGHGSFDGSSAAPGVPESFNVGTSPPPSEALVPAAAEVGQIVQRRKKPVIEKPKVPKKLTMMKVDLPASARPSGERNTKYPLRRRMEPLCGWKNERVIYERKPQSRLPTLCGYYVAADPDDPEGGLQAKSLPQGVIEDSISENVSPSVAEASPAYSPLQDASVAESSPPEPLQRLRKSPSKSASKPKKAVLPVGPSKSSVARRAGRGRQTAPQKKQARQAAAAKPKAGKVVERDVSPSPRQTLSTEYPEAPDELPTSTGPGTGLTERIFHSPASDGALDAVDLADLPAQPNVDATQLDEDSEESSPSPERSAEPARKRQRLFLHANEGASTEIPAVPGSRGGVNMIGGLNIPGLVGCTLIIPPESWNEEEVLPSDRTIMFYVMKSESQTLYAEIDGVGQKVAQGDSFIVHPGRRWIIKNSSTTQNASIKMLLVSQ